MCRSQIPLDRSADELKDEVEGVLGNEYDHMMFRTAESGQKDWVRIFKDPRISANLKHDLLWNIHECSVRGRGFANWDWDDIEQRHARFTNPDAPEESEGNLYRKLLAYLEQSHSPHDERAALSQMGELYTLLWALLRSEDDSELIYIFMSPHVPVSVKAHIIFFLQMDLTDSE